MAQRNASAPKPDFTLQPPFADQRRAAAYGGLVGQMIDDLDARIADVAPQAELSETPADFIHKLSIAAGYGGLAAGFAAVGTSSYWLF